MSIASSLSFLQDSNGAITTSTFNAGAAPITFSINSNLRVEIDSNGYLLINTATSYGSYNLQVNGNAFITGGLTVTTATIGTIIGTVSSATSAQNITFSVDSGSATAQYLAFVSSNAGGVLAPKTYANLTYVPSTGLLSIGSLSVSGTTNLGAVSNVTITGGTSGQYLSTNGAGVLSWSTVVSSGGGASVTIGDSAPARPSAGNLWWDSSVGNLAIYYNDGDSSQWVDAVSAYVFPSTVNNLSITTSTQATSTTTGALIVSGGAGFGGAMYVANTSYVAGAQIITTATISLYASNNSTGTTATFVILSTASSNSTNTGALQVVGGAGIFGGLFVGGSVTSTNLTLTSTATSTSTITGALVVAGGVGIGGNLYIGGSIYSGGNLIGSTLISDTPPSSPYAGMLWWDSSIGNLAIYYTDADSSQWVDAVNTVASGGTSSSSSGTNVTISDTAPSNPTNGQLWWDSTVGNLAIYYSASGVWVDAVNSLAAPSSVGTLAITGLTVSTSTTTGALTVGGGVGISGGLYVGGSIISSSGLVPGELIYRLNTAYVGTATTSAQSFLGVGVTVSGSTVYQFEALFAVSKSAASSHNFQLGFGGTATINNIAYEYYQPVSGITSFNDTANGAVYTGFIQVATATTIATPSAASVFKTVLIKGTVSINAGGTFIPQYTTSVSVGPYTTAIGSYFKLSPIGTAGSNINIGGWA